MSQAISTLQQRFTSPPPDAIQSDHQCHICWTEYTSSDPAIQLPCGHIFGQECILAWAQGSKPNGRHNACPTCGAELLPPSLHSFMAAAVWWWESFWQDFSTYIGGRYVKAIFLAEILGSVGARLFPGFSPFIWLLHGSAVCLGVVLSYKLGKLLGWKETVRAEASASLTGVVGGLAMLWICVDFGPAVDAN